MRTPSPLPLTRAALSRKRERGSFSLFFRSLYGLDPLMPCMLGIGIHAFQCLAVAGSQRSTQTRQLRHVGIQLIQQSRLVRQ